VISGEAFVKNADTLEGVRSSTNRFSPGKSNARAFRIPVLSGGHPMRLSGFAPIAIVAAMLASAS
jgi:hypothetical protein